MINIRIKYVADTSDAGVVTRYVEREFEDMGTVWDTLNAISQFDWIYSIGIEFLDRIDSD